MGTAISRIIPYCGAAPLPDQLWARWNLDPVLIAALIIFACLYGMGAARLKRGGRALTMGEQTAFYSGWALVAAALISPLCALSVSLFAARVGQHMILTLLAAPLVAMGRPFLALSGFRRGKDAFNRQGPNAPLLAAGLFAALLWFWHAPAPYAATFASSLTYWAMHISLFGAALWLWSGLLVRSPAATMSAIAAGAASSMQMGFLGALITLAPHSVYAPHALTTILWGLTPLEDQQLGGAIMWIPGGAIFLAVSMFTLRLFLTGMASPASPSLRPAGAEV